MGVAGPSSSCATQHWWAVAINLLQARSNRRTSVCRRSAMGWGRVLDIPILLLRMQNHHFFEVVLGNAQNGASGKRMKSVLTAITTVHFDRTEPDAWLDVLQSVPTTVSRGRTDTLRALCTRNPLFGFLVLDRDRSPSSRLLNCENRSMSCRSKVDRDRDRRPILIAPCSCESRHAQLTSLPPLDGARRADRCYSRPLQCTTRRSICRMTRSSP